ncbi:PorT family protein [candidate division WOR-3 bacterium]|nr:PorT family protein [candidate division WOR-3 bacterium]
MKKAFIISLIIAASANLIYTGVVAGIKTGLNVSSLYGGRDSDDGTRRGFYTGIFVNVPFNEFLSFQPEFLFTSKGKENTYMIGYTKYKKTVSIYYLEFPFLLKFKALDRGTLKYNFIAGPYFSYFTGGVSNFPLGSNPVTEEIEYLLNGKVREGDFGFTIGAQMDIIVLDFEKWVLSIDIRHTLGLNPVHSHDYELLFLIDQKNKTSSITVGLGYIL